MTKYIINSNNDENGRHEIHKANYCNHLPAPKNQKHLGWFSTPAEALKYAKTHGYPTADGCYYCCNPIHRG